MQESRQEIVITGINGFVGEHLAHHLKDSGYSVRGVGREINANANVSPFVDTYESADLLDGESVDKLTLKSASAIIHLAGLASVAESFDKPDLYKAGNADITKNLLSAAKEQGFQGRVVAISTGALYSPTAPMPLDESSETAQNSPYAIGKIRAEEVIKQYREDGLDAVIARPFNHIGPGQGPGFLVGDLYDQLNAAKVSGDNEILVGNLATKRDYTDVRDIVEAYTLLATAPALQYDTYNIASGSSLEGFEILEYLKTAMELEAIKPVTDPSRIRPTDVMDITGDASRIQGELGWEPKLAVRDAIKDFVERKKNTA